MNRHALIVENNSDDAFFIQWAFRQSPNFTSFYLCRNLSEAKAYVRGVGVYSDRKRYPEPDAVLCDYRLPDGTGGELLQSFRAEKLIPGIPFCFLSGSATPEELGRLSSLEPTAIYSKSVSFFELCRIVGELPGAAGSVEARREHAL